MAIVLPGPDRLPAGPRREFLEAMHALYDAAGQPGARVISRDIRRNQDLRETVSHETVSSVLRGGSVSTWAKVHSIIVALAQQSTRQYDLRELSAGLQQLWLAAKSDPHVLAGEPLADPVLTTNNSVPFAVTPLRSPPDLVVRPPLSRDWLARQTDASSLTRQRLPIVGGIPDRNPHFTGREIILDAMRRLLLANSHAPLVLYGLGGAGKTQLAREYLHYHEDSYQIVWWIQATSARRVRASLISLAERMALPIQRGAEQTVLGVIQRLESRQFSYILVFDGVEEAEIRPLIPAVGGHVVMTCRDPVWAHDPSTVGLEVPEFDRAEAIQFLRKRSGVMSSSDADRLVTAIGMLPLALEQLTALQLATSEPWETLLSRVRESDAGLLSAAAPAHYPGTISASLQFALEQLRLANPVAHLTFELFAWFGAEPVSMALLRAGRTGAVSPLLSRVLSDPLQLNRAIADINRFGLARLNTEGQRVAVQPMMRLALRDVLSAEERDRARHNVHAILTAADPGWPDELATLEIHREMAAHVLPSEMIHSPVEETLRTVYHQIRYRYLYGDYQDACDLAEAALAVWQQEDSLGPRHKLVMLVTRQLANALRDLGRYREARELTTNAMQQLRTDPDFGNDHEDTMAMAGGYAADLRIGGDYGQALRVTRDSFDRHVTRYGVTHLRTLLSKHNMAVSLRLVGDFEAAMALDRVALEHCREAYGLSHTRTMMSANALAEDLYGLGQYEKALEELRPYMSAALRPPGKTYRALLLMRRTDALARRGMGQRGEAMESLREHYHESIASLGSDHEYTLAAAMSYANALRQCGYHDEAKFYATDTVSTYRRVFGPRNPLTLAAEVNLGVILRAQGELSHARQADEVASAALKNVVGEAHPLTIAAMVNLATDYALSGDGESARALSERTYVVAQQVYRGEHPVTLVAAANLAIDRAATGERQEGARLLEAAVGGLRRTLGPDHPTIVDVVGGHRVDCDIESPST